MIDHDKLLKLRAAATAGPWERRGADVFMKTHEIYWRICEGGSVADMDLIALAPELADAVLAHPAVLDKLQAELDAANAEAYACGSERETWKDRAEAAELARDDAQALVSCACGYDTPTDICAGHIAILNRVSPDHPAFDRARKDSEAKLTLAVEALEEIDMRGLQFSPVDMADIARAALAAINGETK